MDGLAGPGHGELLAGGADVALLVPVVGLDVEGLYAEHVAADVELAAHVKQGAQVLLED